METFKISKEYNINEKKPELYVVTNKEGNPVTFSTATYGAWKKPKPIYWRKGDAEATAKNLNETARRLNFDEVFKVVKFVPEIKI